MDTHTVDVLIIGGSMAGSCLARSLKMNHPELSIMVLEKKTKFNHGIGESMLEIFWDYASKDLGLSNYLESNYYYKHGLRFFFEKDDKRTPIAQMSEMGRTWYHAIPAHQINRAKFDEDLIELNTKMGINTKRGISVINVELGNRNRPHLVNTAEGVVYKCKWLVDASGLSSVLSKQLHDVERLKEHPVSSAWMRVQNLRDINELGELSWRERVNFTNRSLSTNHFMYRGYWIWLIPLDSETSSIGVVWHHEKSNVSIKNQIDLEEFILSHKWGRELFGESYKVLDFGAMKNMARIAKKIFSKDRWFRTGMAAGFIDPLFSSGSAWLTDINRMISDVIKTDLEGGADQVDRKIAGYDLYSRWWYENFILHITGNYHENYDLHKVLFRALLMDYFGIVMPASIGEYWKNFADLNDAELEILRKKLQNEYSHGGAAFAHKVKDELNDFLANNFEPLAGNIGNFHDVEIPNSYMVNSLKRGKDFSESSVQEIRKQIEIEAILEACKVIMERRNQEINPETLDMISCEYKTGKIKNLVQAIACIETSTKAAI